MAQTNPGYVLDGDEQTQGRPGSYGLFSSGSFRKIDPDDVYYSEKGQVPLDTVSSAVNGVIQPTPAPVEDDTPQVYCVPTVFCKCIRSERIRIYKNILVMSLTFLFNFTAFQSLSNLQSSLNIEGSIGTTSLSIVYGALVVSCMFLPKFLINLLGCKWTVTFSVLCYSLYILANFWPMWETFIPGAIILGLGAAPLWSAKCTYLTETGVEFAKLTGEQPEAVINRFFGFFFLVFQTGQIWGNLISSLLLFKREDGDNNSTISLPDELLDTCGANFCPTTNISANENLTKPAESQINTMLIIYLTVSLCGSLLSACFLDSLQRVKKQKLENEQLQKQSWCVRVFEPWTLVATFLHMRNLNQLLLIPITIYSGLEQGFLGGDYTQAFVSCSLGIYMVGFVIICFGVANALCSYIFGQLVKYVGQIPFFLLAAALNYGVQISWLMWRPDPDALVIYFVFAALWGMSDAVWQAQINAMYGSIFSDNSEAAFSNYRLWESLGFILAYAYQGYLCVNIKIYILLSVLTLGMIGYFIVEYRVRKKRREEAE